MNDEYAVQVSRIDVCILTIDGIIAVQQGNTILIRAALSFDLFS